MHPFLPGVGLSAGAGGKAHGTRRSTKPPEFFLVNAEAHGRLFLCEFVCDLHTFACISQSHHTEFMEQLKVNPLRLCPRQRQSRHVASFPLKFLLIECEIIFIIPEDFKGCGKHTTQSEKQHYLTLTEHLLCVKHCSMSCKYILLISSTTQKVGSMNISILQVRRLRFTSLSSRGSSVV